MPRAFFHVGVPKTGTTFLQGVLWEHRELALRHGLVLPLDGAGDHYRASLEATARADRARSPERVPGSWARLVDAVASSSADTLVTHELFAHATPDQAARCLDELAATGHEVHVILTVRDLARQVPSLWQETLKASRDWTMAEFIGEIKDDRTDAGRDLARILDYPGLVATWSQGLPPERVHLVTVPPPGAPRPLLWERFCSVVGLPDAEFSLSVPDSNESLGAVQAETLRRVNRELGGRISWPMPYTPVVKGGLARKVLAGRGGGRIGVPGTEWAWLSERSTRSVERLAASGADVVGDLSELLVHSDAPDPDDGRPSDAQVADEAIAAVAGLLLAAADSRAEQPARVARLKEALPLPHDRESGPLRRSARRIVRRMRHG